MQGTRLDLPLRQAGAAVDLAAFDQPEAAQPLAKEILSEGSFSRTRMTDYLTGMERIERFADTGEEKHLHTGMCVRYIQREQFDIHPDDPNSASGQQNWVKAYRRGDWMAKVETEVRVEAHGDCWHITAHLTARDADGVVMERSWDEKIPRDMV